MSGDDGDSGSAEGVNVFAHGADTPDPAVTVSPGLVSGSVSTDTVTPAPGTGGDSDPMVDAVLSASRVLVAVAARSLADLAEEVTLTQYRSLVVLASRGPQGIASLADALAVTPPTASRLCERLVRKGLVRRRTDRQDRRQVRVALTQPGRQLVDVVTERRRREIADLLRAVPPDARRSVVSGLQLLANAGGEVPEQHWSTGWDL